MNTTDQWRTSSYTGSNGDCVEVCPIDLAWRVRDTKNRSGGELAVPSGSWRAFTAAVAR